MSQLGKALLYVSVGLIVFVFFIWFAVKNAFERGETQAAVPTVLGGSVYVGRADALYRLDVASGDVKWRHKTDSPVFVQPAVTDGSVYFATWDGTLACLRVDTGDLNWKVNTARCPSSPICVGRLVCLKAGSDCQAFDAKSGFEVWTQSHSTAGMTIPLSDVNTQSSTMYYSVGVGGGSVAARDALTGRLKWTREIGGTSLGGSPVANDRMVCVQRVNGLYFLETTTGDVSWELRDDAFSTMSPVMGDGAVYVVGRKDPHAVDLDAHRVSWRYAIDRSNGLTQPVIAGGMIYMGIGRVVHAIDAKSGEKKWTYSAPALIRSPAGGREWNCLLCRQERADMCCRRLDWKASMATKAQCRAIEDGRHSNALDRPFAVELPMPNRQNAPHVV